MPYHVIIHVNGECSILITVFIFKFLIYIFIRQLYHAIQPQPIED